ncbi:MAG: hypothetical protein BAJATHORv1_40177 [Candidatus Thorarchaeota archaeon]|nr:MAG: hypothetical protein BAJATHORv1_40177 [Candidatus Thorarchaeota archaeon]
MTIEDIPSSGKTKDDQIFKMVEHSYDRMGERYHKSRNNDKFMRQLKQFVELLPLAANVLDAGCGVGKPTSEYLSNEGLKVIGIDLSRKMVDLAKQNVPDAEFHQMNILELDFPDESFDGIICVYTLWHIPREYHEKIIENFHRMLNNDGILVLNTGVYESDGMSKFFGEPMLWSTNNPQKTLRVVKNLGFEILQEGILNLGGERQYWIFAKK